MAIVFTDLDGRIYVENNRPTAIPAPGAGQFLIVAPGDGLLVNGVLKATGAPAPQSPLKTYFCYQITRTTIGGLPLNDIYLGMMDLSLSISVSFAWPSKNQYIINFFCITIYRPLVGPLQINRTQNGATIGPASVTTVDATIPDITGLNYTPHVFWPAFNNGLPSTP